MKEVQPFSKLQECPKCLSKYTRKKHCTLTDGREYIEVTCEMCGYHWNMETADAGKKQVILEKKEKDEELSVEEK